MKRSPNPTKVDAGGITRYAQLAMALRHRIVSGEWPVGSQLPTVDQLAQESGLAKITIRQAFAMLAAEGLIVSQRGRGTYVESVPTGANLGLRSAINDLLVGSADLQIRLLEKSAGHELPVALARSGRPAQNYVRLVKLHLQNGVPFCLMELYVAADVYRKFPKGAEKRYKIAHLLREAEGDRIGPLLQTITVEPADSLIASRLEYNFAAPLVRIARITRDLDNAILTAGYFWYRGDRFILEMEMPAGLVYRHPEVVVPDSRRLDQELSSLIGKIV